MTQVTKIELHIDTVEYGKVRFKLVQKERKDIEKEYEVKPHESNLILENLDSFLKGAKIFNPKSEIRQLVIYKGTGSFTGLRIGMAVAEALSMVWQVPIAVKNKETPLNK